MNNISNRDMEWLAGIFEGEGTCGMYHSGRGDELRLSVHIYNNDRSMLEEIEKIVNLGVPNAVGTVKRYRKNAKQAYAWRIGNHKNCLMFLLNLYPFLRTDYKKRQVGNLLARDEWEKVRGSHEKKYYPFGGVQHQMG